MQAQPTPVHLGLLVLRPARAAGRLAPVGTFTEGYSELPPVRGSAAAALAVHSFDRAVSASRVDLARASISLQRAIASALSAMMEMMSSNG